MITGFVGQEIVRGDDGYMRYNTSALYDYVLSWDGVWADGEHRHAYEVFDNLIDIEDAPKQRQHNING